MHGGSDFGSSKMASVMARVGSKPVFFFERISGVKPHSLGEQTLAIPLQSTSTPAHISPPTLLNKLWPFGLPFPQKLLAESARSVCLPKLSERLAPTLIPRHTLLPAMFQGLRSNTGSSNESYPISWLSSEWSLTGSLTGNKALAAEIGNC